MTFAATEPSPVEAALIAADWALRTCAPLALEAVGAVNEAANLRAGAPLACQQDAGALVLQAQACWTLKADAAGACFYAAANAGFYAFDNAADADAATVDAACNALAAGVTDPVVTLVSGGMPVWMALQVAPLLGLN